MQSFNSRFKEEGHSLFLEAQVFAGLVKVVNWRMEYYNTYRHYSTLGYIAPLAFVCAALARHIYHCLRFNDPYDVEKAFWGSVISPASEGKWLSLGAELDEKFEAMEKSSAR